MKRNAYWNNLDNLKALKEAGYIHIASIVKQVYTTSYYRLVDIDAIITNDCTWPHRTEADRYRNGDRERDIDWSTTIKRSDLTRGMLERRRVVDATED